MRHVLAFAVSLGLAPAFAQAVTPVSCAVASPSPTLVRLNGASELAGDVVATCTGGDPSVASLVNITLFLNVDATPRITNTSTSETETLLLIDEPQASLPNSSNGCPYVGQVLGTLGGAACGNGNVFQGTVTNLNNILQWLGVPFVPPGAGTRVLRFSNIRGDAALLGAPPANVMQAVIAVAGSLSVSVTGTPVDIAFADPGLKFTTATPVGAVGAIDLNFAELFPTAFKKRIENTLGGPLTAVRQDIPGHFYCTESGFIPQFSPTTPNAIGSATTGTRLLADFAGLPPSVFFLIVPNEVTSSSGALVAHRVFPPLGSDFAGGFLPIIPGFSIAPVSATHTAEVLYEVTANSPFQGVNGCGAIESFNIPAFSVFPTSLAPATITGRLAPIDPNRFASATSPEPRILP
jgi:hypothetical protein